METRQNGLLVVGEGIQQSLLLSPRDGDDGAVTRCELAFHLRILHELEGLQVPKPAKIESPVSK